MDFFGTLITPQAKENVLKVLDSGRLSEGEFVRFFERAIEEEFGMKNCVAVNSGTSALHLALILAGVGEGDEVILPAQTFVATGLAVLCCGATPVFADIGVDGNIDVKNFVPKRTKDTKVIIAVSWGGNPCDLRELRDYCDQTNLFLIQDNAQALGATYLGEPLSEWGDFNCYSFQAIKNLSTGDGGLLACRYGYMFRRAKRLRWFGIDRENDKADETGERQYDLEEAGYKYHMNDVAAALGLGNLHGFKERRERVQEIAQIYDERLRRDVMNGGLSIVSKKPGCSYWLYDVLVSYRSEFLKAMKSRGVPVSVVHVGIDRNTVFGGKKDLPVQRYWDEHHVCLPIHSGLTDEDVEKVVEGVLKGW